MHGEPPATEEAAFKILAEEATYPVEGVTINDGRSVTANAERPAAASVMAPNLAEGEAVAAADAHEEILLRQRQIKKYRKLLREIEELRKRFSAAGAPSPNKDQRKKMAREQEVSNMISETEAELARLQGLAKGTECRAMPGEEPAPAGLLATEDATSVGSAAKVEFSPSLAVLTAGDDELAALEPLATVAPKDSFGSFAANVAAARKVICVNLNEYGKRCKSRVEQSLKNGDIEDVHRALLVLEETSVRFDPLLHDSLAIKPILEETQGWIRVVFNETQQEAFEAIKSDQMTVAQKNIGVLNAMLPLQSLFTEFSPSDVVRRLLQEYQSKTDDFTPKAWHLFQNDKYDEFADLITGSAGGAGDEIDRECLAFKRHVLQITEQGVAAAMGVVVQGKFRYDWTLPHNCGEVAHTVEKHLRMKPLGRTISDRFPVLIDELNHHILAYLRLVAENSVSAANDGNFLFAHTAQQSLGEALRLQLSPDTVKPYLANLKEKLDYVVASLPSRLEAILGQPNPSGESLDDFFDGLASASQVSPRTPFSASDVAQINPLRSRLDEFLRTLCQDIKHAYMDYDVCAGHPVFQKLARIMTATTSKRVFYDNEDVGVPHLRQLREMTVDEMFRESWISGGAVETVKKKLENVSALDPVVYRKKLSRFLEDHVASPAKDI